MGFDKNELHAPEVEQEKHRYSSRRILIGLLWLVARGLVQGTSLKRVSGCEDETVCNIKRTTRLTVNSTAAPPIKQGRRPSRSMIWALMMVPTIPIVLIPPANPFCLMSLYPAWCSKTGE